GHGRRLGRSRVRLPGHLRAPPRSSHLAAPGPRRARRGGVQASMIEAVIFDWGGTLSTFVEAELVDGWRLAARHLAPEREDELTAKLVEVEQAFWATTATDMRSGTLADLLSSATAKLGLDVAEALLEEAAVRHLEAWTPHVRHDADAAPAIGSLRERGLRIGLLSNTHWPRP